MGPGGAAAKPLGGRFALVREIGVGGMAAVYLGRDEVLDRSVAVKILKSGFEDSHVGDRFRREGRTAARLSHPNIVQVYDAGEDLLDGDEVSYIVMEHVPGGDLKDLMDREGPLPEGKLSRIGADVAAGLAHAHGRGVIHRDVKPRNVLIDEYGSPKIADFGLARALDAAPTSLATRTGAYLGTALYSAPEQLKGERVTPKSDVYSLGETLYHAAVGRPPFSGSPIEVASQQITASPVPPRARGATIGEAVEALILGCLAKSPDDRPDASTLRQRLLQASAGVVSASAGQAWASRPSSKPGATADAVKAAADAGAAGIAKAAGAAKAAAGAGVGAVRQSLDGREARREPAKLGGPPEITISVSRQTFTSASRQRATLAVLGAGLLLLLIIVVGAFALLRPGADANPPDGSGKNQQQAAVEEKAQGTKEKAAGGPSGGDRPDAPDVRNASADKGPSGSSGGSGGGASAEDAVPAPALAGAERAVYDMYIDASYWRWSASYEYLSKRKQREVGSVAGWRDQFEGGINYVDFPAMPEAELAGEEARVGFGAVLSYDTKAPERITGTWVCVNEGGRWKLDRLEE